MRKKNGTTRPRGKLRLRELPRFAKVTLLTSSPARVLPEPTLATHTALPGTSRDLEYLLEIRGRVPTWPCYSPASRGHFRRWKGKELKESISKAPCWQPRSLTLLLTEHPVPREAVLSSAGSGRRSKAVRVLGEFSPGRLLTISLRLRFIPSTPEPSITGRGAPGRGNGRLLGVILA